VTSLNVELGKKEVILDEVKEKLRKHFLKLFEAEFHETKKSAKV